MKAIHLKILFIVFILLGTVSCKIIRLNKFTRPVDEDNLSYNTKFIQIDSNNVAIYECENFVENALENNTIKSISQKYKFLKITKEPTINIHNPAIIDTIFTFSNNKNIVRIYKAYKNDFVFMLDVTNTKFKLTGDIKPGMSKAAFSQKFRITETIDEKVQLTNSEGTIEYLFYFKRNKLKRITASLYLD